MTHKSENTTLEDLIIPLTALGATALALYFGIKYFRTNQTPPQDPPKRQDSFFAITFVSSKEAKEFFDYPEGLKKLSERNYAKGLYLGRYSMFDGDPDREKVRREVVEDKVFMGDERMDRAMGCLLGLAISDSLGHPFEFSPVRYNETEMKNGFEDVDIWKKGFYNKFRLQPGQWTDDTSMALCLADSLIAKQGFNALDLRLRFLLWIQLGYCNAFAYDDKRESKHSVGLGGNISMSMREFMEKKTEFTTAGDKETSGNGSLMRNAAIPIFYSNDILEAEEKAAFQSKTTHQGDEAAECCRLLTHIVVKAINKGKEATVQNILSDLTAFKTDLYSVKCLTLSQSEEQHQDNAKYELKDRDWNWKKNDFKYSPSRSKNNSGYIGSYAMDCLSMALHCVWTTNSFKEAVLKCVNLRGDSDSVGAVCGQIAGAIYGAQAIPRSWIKTLLEWDPNGDIPLRAYKLYTHKKC